jgi:hypothetical protein
MRLLDRQRRLLAYLTSSAAIFGDRREGGLDPVLQGIARDRLDLEARFSHEKRMQKIAVVFPRTIALLGDGYAAIMRAFADTCPPHDISRIANAYQFHDFLEAHCKQEEPWPPHLFDVAACELACAEVRLVSDHGRAEARPSSKAGLRRRRDVVLLRCAYDIRSVFENGGSVAAPIARQTCIAIAPDPHTAEPRILELTPRVFELIAALDAWTDPTAFQETTEAAALTAELAEAGLVEIRH